MRLCKSLRATVLVATVLFLAMLVPPVVAQPMATGGSEEPHGLLIGVTAVERPDPLQLDHTQNLRLYTFFYNASDHVQTVDWRTRRLTGGRRIYANSQDELYKTFLVEPGQVVLMRSYFYSKHGYPNFKHLLFSVRNARNRLYSVTGIPGATNEGAFQTLPRALRRRLVEAFMVDQSWHWWAKGHSS